MDGVFPKVVFTVSGIGIRDTVISSWIMVVLIVVIILIFNRFKPGAIEMLFKTINNMLSDVMGIDATPYMPFLGSIMLYIMFANVIGIIPGISSPTKDINTPIALALVVFFSVYYYGIRDKGLWNYLKSLADPIILLPFELIGQFSRSLSLTLRLFGNIISGEMIVAIMFMLVPLFVPIPMAGLGIFTGVLQAYIFTVLTSTYIAASVESNEPIKELDEEKK
jgi:F-type H+-transporting ATPase subunit a